ncbi:hypothetical protein AK812_SmicGene39654, partial [Symbiodinium microadriaticum]
MKKRYLQGDGRLMALFFKQDAFDSEMPLDLQTFHFRMTPKLETAAKLGPMSEQRSKYSDRTSKAGMQVSRTAAPWCGEADPVRASPGVMISPNIEDFPLDMADK